MRRRILAAAIAASILTASVGIPAGLGAFNLRDQDIIEESSVSDVGIGNYYRLSFVEGSTSSSDTANVASLPSSLVIDRDADLNPQLIDLVPSKEGYVFTGYYTDEAMTKELRFYEPLKDAEESSDIKIYVKFSKLSTYTDTFHNNKILNGEITLADYGADSGADDTENSGFIWKESNSGESKSEIPQDMYLNVADSEISDTVELKVYGYGFDYTESNIAKTPSYQANSHTYWEGSELSPQNMTTIIYKDAKRFTLSLTQDLTIKSGGKLIIGGTIRIDNNGFLNAMDGDYFALDLNGHRLIVEEGAELRIHGMIVDSSGKGMIVVLEGGTAVTNLTATFNSGWLMMGAVMFGCTPLNQYGFPLLRARARLHAGSMIHGLMTVGTNVLGLENVAEIEAAFSGPAAAEEDDRAEGDSSSEDVAEDSDSADPLFTIEAIDEESPAYLDIYNNMVPDGNTYSNTTDSWDREYRSHLEFNNVDVVMDSLDLVISLGGLALSISSNAFLWQLPGSTDVVLNDSNLTIRQRFELDPGMTFYADADSSVTLSPGENSTERGPAAGIIAGGKIVEALKDANVYIGTSYTNTGNHLLSNLRDRGEARVTILGDLKFEKESEKVEDAQTNEDSTIYLGGNINLSEKALNSVLEAASQDIVSLKTEGGMPFSLYKDEAGPSGMYHFFNYPLIANGKVYTKQTISGDSTIDLLDGSFVPLNGDTTNGVYTDGEKMYGYFLDDPNREDKQIFTFYTTLKEIEYDSETRTYSIVGDENKDRYIYFAGTFCKVEDEVTEDKATINTEAFLTNQDEMDEFELTWDETRGRWVRPD